MRRMRWVLLLLCVGARVSASPLLLPNGNAIGAQREMFALGVSLQMGAAESEVFLARVKQLQTIEPGSDTLAATKSLAGQARDLRGVELRSYQHSALILHKLGAPPGLLTWADGTVRLLTAPQIVSAEAKSEAKSDPDTAAILAEIDEAEAVKVIGDRTNAAMQAWVKLSEGGGGAWALTVGRLAAGMEASSMSGQPFLLPRESVRRLRMGAPPGVPLAVLRALSALVPRGRGNLSGLIRLSDVTVPADQIALPAQAIVDAYGAQGLVSEIAPIGH